MTTPKHPAQLQIAISFKMKRELQKIAKERKMSVSELVRYWLEGHIEYWLEY